MTIDPFLHAVVNSPAEDPISITTCTDPFSMRRLQCLDMGRGRDPCAFSSWTPGPHPSIHGGHPSKFSRAKTLKLRRKLRINGIFSFVSEISETGVTSPRLQLQL